MNRFGFYEIVSSRNTRSESYTVKKGDSLYKIAKKYGVSVNDILSENNLLSAIIYPNQVIVIPVRVPSGAMYFEEYVIEPNDTLELISNKIGVTTDLIDRYNDITKLILMEDQVLNIPKSYSVYTITADDTLETILQKANMTLEELVNANYNKWLAVGNKIYVKE